MSRLPFPGVLDNKERQNLDSLEFSNQGGRILYTFDTSLTTPKKIISLPRNTILPSVFWVVRVEEAFKEMAFLYLGPLKSMTEASLNQNEILHFELWAPGVREAQGEYLNYIMKPFTEPMDIYISLIDPNKSSSGSGYGFLEWVNLNKVRTI